MRLSLKDFLKSPDQNLNFEGQIEDNKTDYVIDGLNLNFPIEYSGNFKKLGADNLMLELKVNYTFDTNCDRCLIPMKESVNSTLNAYHLDIETEESGMQYFQMENEEVFIDDLVISQVITTIPLKSLCKEDCKGLCPKCGTDLNLSECDCEKEEQIDPRFEKLLNLFNEEV